MKTRVYPSSMEGKVQAPPSKSYTQRALLAALLARGQSELIHPGTSDDEINMAGVIRQLGAEIDFLQDRWIIKGGMGNNPVTSDLYTGESGLGMRLIIPLAAMLGQKITVSGSGSLNNRPMKIFEDLLRQAGGKGTTSQGLPPVVVEGPLKGGTIRLDGSAGSQFLSGLLFALPLARNDSKILATNLKSTPYIDMTLEVLKHFGIEIRQHRYETFEIPGRQTYRPASVTIEGDWSNAAFLLTGGAIQGRVTLYGLDANSRQADRRMLEALEMAGVPCHTGQGSVGVSSPPSIKSFQFDATHCPDLFPPLAVLAAYATGTSSIRGVHRLEHKESNRARALTQGFRNIGIQAYADDKDRLIIHGGTPQGGTLDSFNDHRIAMAAAMLALKARAPIDILRSQAVKKSFPSFFETLQQLHVQTEETP
jgi:3-phosphoshikimate 1-carboxyvinyltransferase